MDFSWKMILQLEINEKEVSECLSPHGENEHGSFHERFYTLMSTPRATNFSIQEK